MLYLVIHNFKYFSAGPHREGDNVATVGSRAENRDQAQRLLGNVASSQVYTLYSPPHDFISYLGRGASVSPAYTLLYFYFYTFLLSVSGLYFAVLLLFLLSISGLYFSYTFLLSVSGLYFANPQSNYFSLGKIQKDQVNNTMMTIRKKERKYTNWTRWKILWWQLKGR